jgi:succinyl-CoA synthetase beta subunit
MNFEEHVGKALLAAAGIEVPEGELATSAEAAGEIAARLGPCAVKAQVAAGRRGQAGGIRMADGAEAARAAAKALLGATIGGHPVERVLVERRVAIARELYAALLMDAESKGPLILASARGGMEVEEIARRHPDSLIRIPVDITIGIEARELAVRLADRSPDDLPRQAPDMLARLYRVFARNDAELLEINPLALTEGGRLVALDCKLVLDDAAIPRRPELAALGTPEPKTPLEAKAADHGLKFIELDGDVGVLANGAGLTMTTMDAIRYYGGAPANFLEIGGEAYLLAGPALEIVLANQRVRSLVVNFCGAFARTDVMTEGIVEAWQQLRPGVRVFFSIHGTGEDEAVALVRERLGLEPFDLMDDAVKAAVEAAR